MAEAQKAEGPDFAAGVAAAMLPDGATIAGHVGEDVVLLSRRGAECFAVSGSCTHYGGPLGHGVVEGDHVHCPWHHACFSLRTGEAKAAPAFDALKRWRVEENAGRIFVREPLTSPLPRPTQQGGPRRILIIGGGASAFAAAEMLRRRGFDGDLTVVSSDADPPIDRPNLSKDYLAGNAPPDWIPMKPADFYRDNRIGLKLATTFAEIDRQGRQAKTATGEVFGYDALLLATGASPIRLKGFEHPAVHVLRTLKDADALIGAASRAKKAAIIGAGFIGLETAASRRSRGLEVDVVAPEAVPLLKVLGEEVGRLVQAIHEEHGVRFHLGESAERFDGAKLYLKGGKTIEADLMVMGVGVRPNIELAAKVGLTVSNGVEVDAFLRTSDPAIFAVGDIAAFPDALSGARARVEHWVVATQQGQIAAINMLGGAERYERAPFFWSAHYDQSLRYIGFAPAWDKVEIDGSIAKRDFTARYRQAGKLLAAASLNRDHENLEIEQQLDAARREASSGRSP
jgi:NADPH-dependent 2,4-dienoyl-CoA reductase/sulfur reductase-like enzyme/nitrite reductase/ring-hydroxylating ferredoxin subunit